MLKLKRFLILVLVSAMLLSCYGCGNDVPAESINTTSRQEHSSSQPNNTEFSDDAEPSEGIQPSEGTTPTNPSQGATEPSTEPTTTQPIEPPVTNPPVTEPPVTNPPVTTPPETEPPVVIQPTTYPTEPEDNGYKGVTPETLTEEAVKNWDVNDYNEFKWKYWSEMTPQQKYDYQVLKSNGYYYSCGVEDHHCVTPLEHENRMTFVCTYCGQIDCDGWVWHPDTLRGMYNQEKCPAYSEFKDPGEYCQTCGKPTAKLGILSITETCNKSIASQNCYSCGVWKEAGACHSCKAENVKSEFKHHVWDTPEPIVLEYIKSYIEDLRNTAEAPQNQFTFENVEDGVMITGYLGSNEIVVFPKAINGQPVVQIKDRFFPENSNVKAVWIPDSVKVLNQTFSHNTTIQAVICEGVETIMPGAFYGCYSLQEVVLGKNFNNLDHLAFYDCISLVKLIEPSESSIFTISGGELIFHGCDRLTIYTDPNSALALFVQSNNLNIKVESLN